MTFAFVPPADGRRLGQLRMALLLRLRRGVQLVSESMHRLRARATVFARSAQGVVVTIRRRVMTDCADRPAGCGPASGFPCG